MTKRDGESVSAAVAKVLLEVGSLRGEQITLAATARLLARDLDEGHGVAENVARELRITVRELVGMRQASGVPVIKDPIAELQDELARKRALRSGA